MSTDYAAAAPTTESGDGEETTVLAHPAPISRLSGISPRWSAVVLPIVGAGVLLNALGVRAGWRGPESQSITLIWAGVVLIFLATSWRLLDPRVDAAERLRCALALGIGLALCRVVAEPHVYNQFDELLHVRTASDLMRTGNLFGDNPLLPASARFPGLELMTDAIAQLTGLPLNAAGAIVIVASRALAVWALFFLVERLGQSAYAAGIAVVVYCASPQFYLFNSQYSYQTLAIGFMFAVLALVVAFDEAEVRRHRVTTLVPPIAGLLALAVTHHLTSWLAIVLLAIWTLCVRLFSGNPGLARWALKIVLPGAGAVVLWTVCSGPMIGQYLAPIFEDAFGQIAGVVGGSNASRKLFSDTSGVTTPLWERGAIIIWSLAWLAAIVPLVRWFPRWGHAAGERWMYRIMFVLGLIYPVILVGRVSPKTAEFTTRFSTFIFVGLSLVIGLMAARFLARRKDRVFRVVALLSVVPFVGGIALGSPDWQRSTGPYLVSADARSVDRFALQAAAWAKDNLPPNAVVAADRVNGALIASQSDIWVPSGLSGGTNIGPLFFGLRFGEYQRSILARNKVEYLVVDQRLATSLPRIGVYVAPGESPPGQHVTTETLAKYDRVAGSIRIYDNGPIRIYSVSSLWQVRPAASAQNAKPAQNTTSTPTRPTTPEGTR